jgi:sec-independent protein translocase protein TatC
MTFVEHLRELRRRIVWALVGVGVVSVMCFSFSPEMFDYLRRPLLTLPHQKLIVLSPLELYVTYIKLAILASLFLSAPWSLAQVWLFIAPGLYGHEKRWVLPFVVLGTLFFAGGGAFAFYVVLPIGFNYVVAAMPATIEAQYSVEVYFSLVTNLMLAFGIVFELPLIMWIVSAAGIVDPQVYSKLRRYWIVVAFIVAAVLTPPDPFTQILMAVPLLFFFEIGVIGARLLYRRRAERALRTT